LSYLIDTITKTIYTNVTRGLFEKDKLIYSFLISVSINKHASILDETLWGLFLRGAGVFDKSKQPANPDKTFIQPLSWDLAYCLELNFPEVFKGFTKHIITKVALWKDYFSSEDPNNEKQPEEWNDKVHILHFIFLTKKNYSFLISSSFFVVVG
jgi:dynein heavy chain